ncbi:hypothetical protein ACFCP7_12270 [Paenibacillus elgii]
MSAPKHSKENVLVEYKKYYNHVTSMEKINNRIGFVYSVVIPDTLGFHLVSNKFQYSDEVKRFWIDDLYLELSYQKAVAIDDETGEYFTYEDINLHYPKGYPIYKEIEDYIKGITKPTRIKINDKVKSFPIRISQNVATDLEQSWAFKENEIEMISYKPKKF